MTGRQPYGEGWQTRIFSGLLEDLRFALRQLRKSPGFTFTAVAVFGVGIAASTAIYACIDAALKCSFVSAARGSK
jgi:hypothetical protein